MENRSLRLLPVALAAALAAVPPLPAAAQGNGAVDAYVATKTHAFPTEHALSAREQLAFAHGATPKEADRIRIAVSLNVRNKDQLDQLVNTLADPAKRGTGQPLTAEAFRARYAPTDDQVNRVVAHLKQSGFTDIEVAPNRLLVTATGSSSNVESAFRTRIRQFSKDDGRLAYANVSGAQVPSSLAPVVNGVLGLDNVFTLHANGRRAPHVAAGDARPAAKAAVAAAAMQVVAHNPIDFVGVYNAAALPTASATSVGIITVGNDMQQVVTDLGLYTSQNKLATVNTKIVQSDGKPADYTAQNNDLDEFDMDSQTIVGVSGGVSSLILYDSPTWSWSDIAVAMNRAVSDNVAKVISMSIGGGETESQPSAANMDQILEAAVAQGQTFVVSSGDNGAYANQGGTGLFQQVSGNAPTLDANVGPTQLGTYSVEFPESSPYVISAGATTLYTQSGNVYGSEVPMDWWYNFITSDGSNKAPSLMWNDSTQKYDTIWATGGGTSAYEPAPAWQSGVNGGSKYRMVPDVAFDGDPQSGVNVIEQTSSGTTQVQYGGTSLAAPLFAGFLARLQTQNGNTLGFPASGLYAALSSASGPSLRHTVGSAASGAGNGVTWNNVNYGYAQNTAWNRATGWGSLNIGNLASYIASNPASFK
ncbi:peptidase S53 [Burkholderia lata]|uniref:Peptidase S53 n=1 Tax=Burkholderia lata (strain ATCC 17760 / DSM 23089 / LMG 22485 / NCIMB 9086 / R18194 / 383) TaxID=482957 RepID=A0A6P2IIM0_BURL3|nr:peptidase S53 [Burkholderia lata]